MFTKLLLLLLPVYFWYHIIVGEGDSRIWLCALLSSILPIYGLILDIQIWFYKTFKK